MPINIPNNATEIEQRQKTDVQRKLPTSNPFLKNSWLGALITGLANRVFDFYLQLKILLREMFWDTSTGDYLRRQASWFGFTELNATKSTGNVVATGTLASQIGNDSVYVSSNGIEYEVLDINEIESNVINVSEIIRNGSAAIVTTESPHGLANNVPITIAGADQSEYNLSDVEIQVTGDDEFTYTISGTPATPATGTITATGVFAIVPIRSIEFQSDSVDVNLEANSILTLQQPIVGVDSEARVDFGGITGGTVDESFDDFRDRFIEGVQNPTAHFNVQAIKDQCREIAGVTRVFVKEITPDIGQVTVYFVRDNDDDIIPSSTQVDEVKNKLLEIKPANTADADVIVSAPDGNVVDFVFTSLSPDTPEMREAIEANLDLFFKEFEDVGISVDEDAYRAAIYSTINPENGDQINNFSLSAPIGDIVNLSNEIAVPGDITYDII